MDISLAVDMLHRSGWRRKRGGRRPPCARAAPHPSSPLPQRGLSGSDARRGLRPPGRSPPAAPNRSEGSPPFDHQALRHAAARLRCRMPRRAAGGERRRPCLRRAPLPPPWTIRRLRSLLHNPERRLSIFVACSGPSSPPRAVTTLRSLHSPSPGLGRPRLHTCDAARARARQARRGAPRAATPPLPPPSLCPREHAGSLIAAWVRCLPPLFALGRSARCATRPRSS